MYRQTLRQAFSCENISPQRVFQEKRAVNGLNIPFPKTRPIPGSYPRVPQPLSSPTPPEPSLPKERLLLSSHARHPERSEGPLYFSMEAVILHNVQISVVVFVEPPLLVHAQPCDGNSRPPSEIRRNGIQALFHSVSRGALHCQAPRNQVSYSPSHNNPLPRKIR